MARVFESIKAFIFDLDGTLYLGDKAIPGALKTIFTLLKHYQIFFLTNNSGKAQRQIVEKLVNLGFPASMQNTYSVSYAISCYLIENKIWPVYIVGSNQLKDEIMSRLGSVETMRPVSAVVVGIDLDFSYERIANALRAIRNGAKLIVANTDSYYPVGDGKVLPGCGAMVGAIIGATGHQPDFHVGKPNIYMLELICKEYGFSKEEICVVGDMPESDIRMAVNFECSSILFDPENAHSGQNFGIKVKSFDELTLLIKEK